MCILNSLLALVVNFRFLVTADHVYKTIDALPITAHPMTQFCTGVMALQVLILIIHFPSYFTIHTKLLAVFFCVPDWFPLLVLMAMLLLIIFNV